MTAMEWICVSHDGRNRTVDAESAIKLGYALGKTAGRQAGLTLGLPGPATMPPARAGGKRKQPPLGVVICARDEGRTIADVVRSARAIPGGPKVVVVANGCRDETAAIARRAGAEVIEYAEPLGHDVGRALGASALPGHDLLFLDGDIVISPEQLRRFVTAVQRGVDVALNDQNPTYSAKPRVGTVTLVRLLLNRLLGRSDLGVNSLLIVPAALSARAVRRITPASLSVPPLAQAKAVLAGLRVAAVPGVDVLAGNRRRPGLNAGADLTPLEMLIIGDHLEAIGHILKRRGPRGGYTDLNRSRATVERLAKATETNETHK